MKKRKVVAYGRVSTEHEMQLNAFENQMDWYKDVIDRHEDWEFVGEYADRGVTGTSADKRERFMDMIQDAHNGRFDLIITKEVSRFARNTVDCLSYVRMLKELKVEVYFISDNIWSMGGDGNEDGELRLSIMATLAQEESRKISTRVLLGQNESFKKGVFYGNGNVLGYDRVETKVNGVKTVEFKVNPEQAKTVRKIFELYLEGRGLRAIKYELQRLGYKTAKGKTEWHDPTISRILQNKFYIGILTYGQSYTTNYLDQKRRLNLGEKDVIEVKGSHEPLIPEEVFEAVQERFEEHRRYLDECTPEDKKQIGKRQRVFGKREPVDVWTSKLICSCGHGFNRKKSHEKNDGTFQYYYMCYGAIRSGSVKTRENQGLSTEGICKSPSLKGWELDLMAVRIFRDCIASETWVKALAEKYAKAKEEQKKGSEGLERTIAEYQEKVSKLESRMSNLIDLMLDGTITKQQFNLKKEEIEKQSVEVRAELQRLMSEKAGKEPVKSMQEIYRTLRALQTPIFDEGVDESTVKIPDALIDTVIEKIVVYPDHLEWHLKVSPDDPIKCKVSGKKKKGEVPEFHYLENTSDANSNTGCYQESPRLIA